jgi:chemotaxis response regulator CheB
MATCTSVLVCDDHALLRSGLSRLLATEEDLDVVGEAANAEEVVERARAIGPDVVLLDIVMPGRSGLEALPELLAASPATKVLVLSMQDDPGYVRSCRRCARLPPDAATCTRCSAPGLPRPSTTGTRRGSQTHSPSASEKCCACWRSVTRTRRSPSSFSSRFVRPRLTARTSCASSGSRPEPRSSATRWRQVS